MTDADLHKMIKECLADDSDRLGDWECEFLDSVNRWTGAFTEKQAATIEKIWDKIFN